VQRLSVNEVESTNCSPSDTDSDSGEITMPAESYSLQQQLDEALNNDERTTIASKSRNSKECSTSSNVILN
jgi:hypothetical protein